MNNDIKYFEAKAFAKDSFNEFFEENEFTFEQSIAAALEDNILPIKKNREVYLGVLVELSLICLENKLLPDYIYYRIEEIVVKKDVTKISDDKDIFLNDIKMISNLLNKKDYSIVKDEIYKMRIDYLLNSLKK